MYNHTKIIPRITPAKLSLLNELAPGLNALVKIPTFVTEEDVRAHVLGIYSSQLPRYEYVREITNVTLDEKTQCWHVSMIISGD